MLERRVRNALDIGSGEGLWRAALRAVRPKLAYTGVDPSEYATRRYGPRRNIRLGDITSLDALRIRGPFDVILCNDVLHYVPTPDLRAGMTLLAKRLRGVAYLGLFTSADDIEGDMKLYLERPPAFYRREFAQAGLRSVGMHCWIRAELAGDRAALEVSGA